MLEKIEGDPTSDYINASYIPVSMTILALLFVTIRHTSMLKVSDETITAGILDC